MFQNHSNVVCFYCKIGLKTSKISKGFALDPLTHVVSLRDVAFGDPTCLEISNYNTLESQSIISYRSFEA